MGRATHPRRYSCFSTVDWSSAKCFNLGYLLRLEGDTLSHPCPPLSLNLAFRVGLRDLPSVNQAQGYGCGLTGPHTHILSPFTEYPFGACPHVIIIGCQFVDGEMPGSVGVNRVRSHARRGLVADAGVCHWAVIRAKHQTAESSGSFALPCGGCHVLRCQQEYRDDKSKNPEPTPFASRTWCASFSSILGKGVNFAASQPWGP